MVRFCWLNTEEEEARHISKIIKEFYLKGSHAYRDIGILYRVNLQSRAIEDALREEGLPYIIVGGVSFYQRKEVKDLIAYTRLVVNHGDNVSLRRIINLPPRGIGAATLLKIENEAKKKSLCLFDAIKLCIRSNTIVTSTRDKLTKFVHMIEKVSSETGRNASETLKNVADKSGYLEIIDDEQKLNIEELISAAEGKSVQEFIDNASLFPKPEDSEAGNFISLMTLHNAKGLEFPVVFVSGLEEGLLPYFKANGHEDEISEERRLFYVGMTRAKDFLVLTGAHKRRLYSKLQDQEPSRFLQDIPKDCCKWVEKVTEIPVSRCFPDLNRKPEPAKIRPHFDSGCRVKHPVWGVGVVRDCYGDGEDQKVMVNFPTIGLKRLSLKLANLTKL
jgi:DNA helicase II / ATP-dependent DNA helicase PcrA